MKLIDKLIDTAEWTDDCCGKQDLDFPILQIMTRYWNDNTASCAFIFGDGNDFHCDILQSDDYITGGTEEEVKCKARQWYKDNYEKALQIFIKKMQSEVE